MELIHEGESHRLKQKQNTGLTVPSAPHPNASKFIMYLFTLINLFYLINILVSDVFIIHLTICQKFKVLIISINLNLMTCLLKKLSTAVPLDKAGRLQDRY